jgi:hypothetical protein
MRKQTVRADAPQERRAMGLRWAVVRKNHPVSRNDHIHLFSTEANARRIREAVQQLDEGRGCRMTFEELRERVGRGEV